MPLLHKRSIKFPTATDLWDALWVNYIPGALTFVSDPAKIDQVDTNHT